ncbi:thioredoxin family protein [Catellatospora bangladeshensis]|uniref:Thioredoxin family protein n=1 Tax=Catellatospora bangladeshensis TaxID=310355 RepID=A0A8J3JRT3_9ACTN|nr:thioredoxin family protein [Catellatospora bangladeshensis]GIF83748.1 thioredoxin family protein [Catellatospora bangladeshensis]
MAVNSFMVELGTPAPGFALADVVSGETVALEDFAGAPALLVAFLSNHCPYVRHIESVFGEVAARYAAQGLAVVGISANETGNYPDDAPEHLAGQVKRAGFGFPYLHDADQRVALAYRAACTPDLFLYDAQRRLAYRGQFDDARPRNDVPVTGATLSAAIDLVLAGQPVPEPQYPSVGCSIKWLPGNDPS